MSTYSGRSKGPLPPERMVTSHTRMNNNDTPPNDKVDLIKLPTKPQMESLQTTSTNLQSSAMSKNRPNPGNDGQSRHFNLENRGAESGFIFPPAPRHARGHFTTRKIVPVVTIPEAHKEASDQLSTNRGLKDEQVSTHHTKGLPDTTDDQPVHVPALALPPVPAGVRTQDGAEKPPAQLKKVRLPVSDTQQSTSANSESQAPVETAQPPAVDSIEANNTRRSPGSPRCTVPPLDFIDADKSRRSPGSPRQSVAPLVSADANSSRRSLGSPRPSAPPPPSGEDMEASTSIEVSDMQKPELMPPPQSNRHFDPELWMRGTQVSGPNQSRQRHQMNRPMKSGPHRVADSRASSSSSSSSGVSKRTTNSRQNLIAFRDRDLPQIATKVNALWTLCNETVKDAETGSQHKVDKYRKKLHERTQQVNDYLETINVQAQAIQNLQDEKQHMHGHIEKLDQKLRDNADELPKLKDKWNTIKGSLDATLKEQQEQNEQYNHFKKSSQDAIQELSAERQREQAAREVVEQKLTAVRDQMKERVRQAELQSQEECRHLNEKLQTLSKQIEEKASQVRREQEHADQLSKQLEEYRHTQLSLEDMKGQTAEIFRLLNERDGEDDFEHLKLNQAESKTKLEYLSEDIKGLRDLFAPQSEAVSALRFKQDEGVSRVLSIHGTMSGAQNGTKESMDKLGKQLQAHIDEMFKHIESREDTLTRQIEETRSKNALLKKAMEEKEQDLQSLERQLQDSKDASQLQEERIQDLVLNVRELEAQPAEDPAVRLRNEVLETEIESLKTDLATESTRASELETQLKAQADSYMAKMDGINETIAGLTQLMNNRPEASNSDTEKTIASIQEECRMKIERVKDTMEERLRQTENERQLVRNQLDEARRKLGTREQKGHHDSNHITALQKSLEEAEVCMRELVENAGGRSSDFEACHEQDAATIRTLQDEVSEWKEKSDRLAATQGSQTELAGVILSKIRDWGKGQAETHGLALDVDELWKELEATTDDKVKTWTSWLETILTQISSHRPSPGRARHADVADLQLLGIRNSRTQAAHHVSGPIPPTPTANSPAQSDPNNGGQYFQPSFNLRPANAPAAVIGVGLRKSVTVQSPHPGVLTPVPPTVEQEKSRRRSNLEPPPKPALKRMTRSTSLASAEAQRPGQGAMPAGSPMPSCSSGPRHTFSSQADLDVEVETETPGHNDPRARIILKDPKRSRRTEESEVTGGYSASTRPERRHDPVEDDDGDAPLAKRARTQNPKAPAANSRRGRKRPAQAKKQKPSGLAGPGVVHGSFPPGTVQGGHYPTGEPKNMS